LGAGAVLANNAIPAPEQTHPLYLAGATVHTVSGESIKGGGVLMEDGKIAAVREAGDQSALPDGTEVIDVSGQHIYPGLIAANTVLGLVEISAVRSTRDLVEPGALNPNVRAEVSVNPDSELLPVTRANGILTALVVPQAEGGGLVAGTSALVELDGWTWESMVVRAPVGMHIRWPQVTFGAVPPGSDEAESARKREREEAGRQLRLLDDLFDGARAYAKAKESGIVGFERDLRLEGVGPVLAGEVPVFAHANDLGRIQSAIDFADRHRVKLVLVGGRDAWRIADQLAGRDIAVIFGPVQELPMRRWEAFDTPFTGPGRLIAAGVLTCVAGEGSSSSAMNERNLPYQAAQAAAHGLPKEEALRAITLYAAQILGAGDRLGSIDPGKDATLIVTDGDPLEVRTQVERAYIRGKPVDLDSRHTRLYEKYQAKYRQKTAE
jgi:imidazolonepropionase-like amidohydrolase